MKYFCKTIYLPLFLLLLIKSNPLQANVGDTCILTCEEALAFSIVDNSKQYIGTPYKYGGCSPTNGFDCSGLMNHLFGKYNIPVERSSHGIASTIPGDPVTLNEAIPGDLLFFTGRNANTSSIGHVALVVSNNSQNDLQMIHSTTSLGVIEENLFSSSYFMPRFLFAIRPDWTKWVE